MKDTKTEDRIQEIRQVLVADEAPSGEERQKLLDELHELELKLQ